MSRDENSIETGGNHVHPFLVDKQTGIRLGHAFVSQVPGPPFHKGCRVVAPAQGNKSQVEDARSHNRSFAGKGVLRDRTTDVRREYNAILIKSLEDLIKTTETQNVWI